MADSLQSRKLAEAKKRVERRSAQRVAKERAEARRAEDQRLENEKLKVDHIREKAIVLEGRKAAEPAKDDMEILEVVTDEEKLRRIRMQQTQAIPSLAAILEGVEDLTDEQKELLETAINQASGDAERGQKKNSLYDSDEARLHRIRMQETRTLPNWDDIMGDMEDFDEDNHEESDMLPKAIEAEDLTADNPKEGTPEEKVSEEQVPEEKTSEEKTSEEKTSEEKTSEEKISEEKISEERNPEVIISEDKISEKENLKEEALKDITIPDNSAKADVSADPKDSTGSLLDDLAAAAAELDSVGGILASLDTAKVTSEHIAAEDISTVSQESVSDEQASDAPKREWRERQRKSKKVFQVAGGVIVVGLIAIYAVGANYFRTHFYPNTMMGDTSIAFMSEEALRSYFANKTENYQLQIHQKDGTVDELRGSDIGMKEVWDETIFQNLQEQHGLAWPIKLIQGDLLPDALSVSYDEKKFRSILNRLDCMSEEKQVMPEDARLSNYTIENGYQVLPPMEGTAIDRQMVTAAAENAVKTYEGSLDLQEMKAYYTMEYVADMDELKKKASVLNDHSHAVINYEIGDEKITLDANTYVEWFDIDENMQVTLNEDKVKEYVAAFAEKYDTYGKPKTFTTSYGTTITIDKYVQYGWEIDQEAECEAIMAEIEAGECVTRDLHYNRKAASHTGNDYGSSYVEVSLTNQELFLYKDGSLLLECKVVTGCTGKGNGTPPGIYRIRYKQQDRVLKGEDYETPVHFWMPFNEGIGLHDAYWRGSFGGEIYKKHGSHGCVNMPSKSAEAAYNLVDKGWPVILYE